MASSRTRELLELLEARWRQEGAPIYLAPGATERDLDAAEHELGFLLPQEIRDWFGWHNGHDADKSLEIDYFMFPIRLFPGTLRPSIANRAETLTTQQQQITRGENLPDLFQPTWLSITQPGNRMIVADCASAIQDRYAPAPIHNVDFWGDPWEPALLPSLTAMLEVWWQLTEAGIWAFNPDGSGDWVIRRDDIPPNLQDTGLFD